MISSFDTLAEVAFARDMLRRWWGLELGLADPAALEGRGTVRLSAAVDALGATAVASVIAALKAVKQPTIIDAGGGVMEPKIDTSTLKSSLVEGCVLRRMAGWKFPLPKGGTQVRVSYPFLFKALD